MNYVGALYGHIPGTRKYFDTGKTSEDWDRLESTIITQAATIKHITARLCVHDNTLSDLGEILGNETMSSAEIIKCVYGMKLALAVIDKWGAVWIDEHIDEEDPKDPTKNCVAQWCIGGDFFEATTHDVAQAAIRFAEKYPNGGES